jgi:hypothetical protein
MKIDTARDSGDGHDEKITVKDRIGAQVVFHHASLDHFGIRVLLPLGHFLQTK